MPHRPIALVAMLILTACSDLATGTSGTPEAPLLGMAHQSAVDAFVAAQGTYCTAAGGKEGDCFNLFGPAGPPDITVWCDITTPAPCPSFDHGVYSRWLIEQGGPDLGTTWRGTAQEKRLPDGRRRVTVGVQFRNALVDLADLEVGDQALDDQVGYEAGLVLGHMPHAVLEGAAPLLGDHSARYEFILPADYQGMPDVVELIFFPKPGMEFLGFDAAGSAVGTMRQEYLGIAAGERARISMHFNWDTMKEGALPAQAHANGIRRTYGSPGMHMDLIRMP